MKNRTGKSTRSGLVGAAIAGARVALLLVSAVQAQAVRSYDSTRQDF